MDDFPLTTVSVFEPAETSCLPVCMIPYLHRAVPNYVMQYVNTSELYSYMYQGLANENRVLNYR
jgi:hypothetical protein